MLVQVEMLKSNQRKEIQMICRVEKKDYAKKRKEVEVIYLTKEKTSRFSDSLSLELFKSKDYFLFAFDV